LAADTLHVVCLCAQWCGTCRDWRAVMDEVAGLHPQVQWRWLDIEDEAVLLGELDVETLPTVLVARGPHVLFYGPVLPRAELLTRLIESLSEAGHPAARVDDEVAALWQRLRLPSV
jgi:thioredoxin 1